MFRQWPQLPIDFVFPIHEVMGTLRPVDSYVADLITALRKAFKVAYYMLQTEVLRQKWRYDKKALTVTLNKGDVVLIRKFVGKRKLKDCWADGVYTVYNQVDVDVPVYFIKKQWGQRQTLHQDWLFLIEKVDSKTDPQVAVRLFNVASTQIDSEVLHWEMSKASTPLIEIQPQAAHPLNIYAQDVQESKLQKLITYAYRTLQAIYAGWWANKELEHMYFCCWNATKIHFWGDTKWTLIWPWCLVTASQWRILGQLLGNFIAVWSWFNSVSQTPSS